MKKFSESIEELQDISSDRVEEIIKSMSEMTSDINQKNEQIDSLINELNNYRSKSGKSSDQIDDAISNLQLIRKSFSDATLTVFSALNNPLIRVKYINAFPSSLSDIQFDTKSSADTIITATASFNYDYFIFETA